MYWLLLPRTQSCLWECLLRLFVMLESCVQRKNGNQALLWRAGVECQFLFIFSFSFRLFSWVLFLIHRLNKFHIFLFTQEFPGNSDASTVVKNELGTVTKARYVRFYALTYNAWPCFKVEIFGQKDRQKWLDLFNAELVKRLTRYQRALKPDVGINQKL